MNLARLGFILIGLFMMLMSLWNWRTRKLTPGEDIKYGSIVEWFAPFLTFFGAAIVLVGAIAWLSEVVG